MKAVRLGRVVAPSISGDAQTSLILALGLTALPHVSRLPFWITLFAGIALVYRLLSIRHQRLLPPKWLVTMLAFGMFVGVSLHYSTLFGRDAGVSLLVGMLFLKLFETKSYRDAMVHLSMIYFVIITNFLYTQSIPTAAYMFFVAAYITLTIISLNAGPGTLPWREKLRITAPLTVLALPIMLLLFVLFPRIPGPIWGLPKDVYTGKTGLSDTMSPGELSQLALSDEVAFRVTFTDAPPSKEFLYWRAIVMPYFDGRTWRGADGANTSAPTINFRGQPVSYTITVEPHQQRWLFALDLSTPLRNATLNTGQQLYYTADAQVMASSPVISLAQYTLTSFTHYRLGNTLSKDERRFYLQLPDYNPRALELAQRWRRENADPASIINKALQLFNAEFTYTLRPPVLGRHIVDEFLFKTRRGFCEHFAGSFAVLMRAAGIPARVVTGYQGGEINPLGDYMVVKQSDAHAWTEVWLDDRGWVRVDPTRAVSPARIEQNLDQAIPASENPRLLLKRNSKLLRQLDMIWDSLNNRWNQWIIGYGPEMQELFLTFLGIQNKAAYNLVLLLTGALAICLAGIALFSFRKARRHHTDKVQKLYDRLCRKLAKAGYIRAPYRGPMDFLQQIETDNPSLAASLRPALQLYIALRYRPVAPADSYQQFSHMVRTLRPERYR